MKAMQDAINATASQKKSHHADLRSRSSWRKISTSSFTHPIRKAKEYFIARALENTDKSASLELYLNVVEFGERVYALKQLRVITQQPIVAHEQPAALLAGCLPNRGS